MPRFIAQARIIKLPDGVDEPDEWSSATSEMMQVEVSQPFDASSVLEAVDIAITVIPGLLTNLARRHTPGWDHPHRAAGQDDPFPLHGADEIRQFLAGGAE